MRSSTSSSSKSRWISKNNLLRINWVEWHFLVFSQGSFKLCLILFMLTCLMFVEVHFLHLQGIYASFVGTFEYVSTGTKDYRFFKLIAKPIYWTWFVEIVQKWINILIIVHIIILLTYAGTTRFRIIVDVLSLWTNLRFILRMSTTFSIGANIASKSSSHCSFS